MVSPGRPADPLLRQKLLTAAAALLQAEGYDGFSLQDVATRAGSSRQTIFRIWGSKAVLVAEAVLDGAWPVTAPVMGTTGSLREDLTAWWYTTAEASLRADTRPIVRALIAAVTEHPQALAAFDALLTHPTREVLQRRIAQAVRDGDCSADVDSTAFADLVIGDLTLLTLGSVELSRARVEQTVQIVLGPPESTS